MAQGSYQGSYQSRYPNVETLRAVFPTTKHCTYLNHAIAGPLPDPVRAAMSKFIADRGVVFERECRYEHVSDDLRGVLAWLINGTPEEIAFVQSAREGMIVIANALPLQPADNVVLCDIAPFPTVQPWMGLQRNGIEARRVPHDGGGLTVKALDIYADAHTRVVVVNSVEFATGFKSNLTALGTWCRDHGATFVVDGTQSLGAAPLDVQVCEVDFLVCGGPTWLMGPPGQGFVYCRQELQDELAPPCAGYVSVASEEGLRDRDVSTAQASARDAHQLELSRGNTVGQVGLLAAVRFLMEVGISTVERWTLHLTELLIEDMRRRGYETTSNVHPSRRSAIVAFNVPKDVNRALDRLTEARVVVSKYDQCIHVSPHCYNTEEEIARVGEVLGDAA